MFLFYAHTIDDDKAFFDEVEMRHCIQVLRKQPGDEIHFTDGMGRYFFGIILSSNKKGFTTTITKMEEVEKHPSCQIHVGIAPTKNIDRFEWFLEKATEFGVSMVTPLICSNSERKKIRADRMEKILLSAMKQSLSAYLPTINPIATFKEFIVNAATGQDFDRFIAHCRTRGLPHLFHNYDGGKDVVVLIGPEGDFSLEEIEMAVENGFQEINLGESRLRTETAGMAAVHIINLKNDIRAIDR